MKGPTIRDVARVAGVSVATVSRVLNGSAPVHQETRARILLAARELRFAPHGAARSLSSRRSHAVGAVLPDLHGEFFSELLRGIDQTAQRHGRHLVVSSSHHDRAGMHAALRAMHGRVDGLVVMAPDIDGDALAELLAHERLPVVLLNCADVTPAAGAPVRALAVDNFGGAHAMTAHLLALGHRDVAFVDGPARNADAGDRRRGYREARRAAGLPPDPTLEARGDFTEESGWRAARALLGRTPRPTAVFAANDAMAVGALGALHEAGLDVPRDTSVVGFDDIPVARYVAPALTTVRVAVDALGARAVDRLLGLMEGRPPPDDGTAPPDGLPPPREVQPAELVVRRSCAPPRPG
jgi:LacI family transcriptional regulator